MPIAFIPTNIFYCNFAYFAIYRGLKSKNCIGKDLNKLIYTVIYRFGALKQNRVPDMGEKWSERSS